MKGTHLVGTIKETNKQITAAYAVLDIKVMRFCQDRLHPQMLR